jgi:hypothetical protein
MLPLRPTRRWLSRLSGCRSDSSTRSQSADNRGSPDFSDRPFQTLEWSVRCPVARAAFLSALRCAFCACLSVGDVGDGAAGDVSVLWANASGAPPSTMPSEASTVIEAIRTRGMASASGKKHARARRRCAGHATHSIASRRVQRLQRAEHAPLRHDSTPDPPPPSALCRVYQR